MATPGWRIRGEYFESCNCEVLCPCLLSNAKARPTEGHCDVVVAVHVMEGAYGCAELGGLSAALAVQTPGAMADGDWSVAMYPCSQPCASPGSSSAPSPLLVSSEWPWGLRASLGPRRGRPPDRMVQARRQRRYYRGGGVDAGEHRGDP